jgi:hypothetical protein
LVRKDKYYQYKIGNAFYSSVGNRLKFQNILITPIYSREKYQKMVEYQSDFFNGRVDSVLVEKPDLRKWFDRESLIGNCVTINGLHLDIYRDKRRLIDEKRRPKMIQEMIKSLKNPIVFDSVKLINSRVTYSEQPLGNGPEGLISFTNINASLHPFTNNKSSGHRVSELFLNGSATIMDSCQLNSNVVFQMNHPDQMFSVKGDLSQFYMRILNPVLEPLASISIRSGKVDRFHFTFNADQNLAKGYLLFGYSDMKVSVLETKNGNTKEAKFASFLANSLLLRSKNPRGKEFLPDEINFIRDKNRSTLNYVWKSVFSGVRNTLGIKETKQDNPVPDK